MILDTIALIIVLAIFAYLAISVIRFIVYLRFRSGIKWGRDD